MTNFSLEVLNPLVLLCGCLLYCTRKPSTLAAGKEINKGGTVLFISFSLSLRKKAVCLSIEKESGLLY